MSKSRDDLPLELRVLSSRRGQERIQEAFDLTIGQMQEARALFQQVREIENAPGYSVFEAMQCLQLMERAQELLLEARRRWESPIVQYGRARLAEFKKRVDRRNSK